jgi:hypothetical protein
VTFAPYDQKSIFEIHYTTAEVFDVQRSPAFPDDSAASSIRFSWLAQPYDTNLDHITLGTGEYIKFDKVSSVETAGKTAEYTESLQYWTDATKIGTAALVEENVYKNVNGTPTLQRTLGTGLIWCYNDPAKGFMFTTMDGVLGDCGGVGSYVSFNALRYGSSVTQLTDSAEPLQWVMTGQKTASIMTTRRDSRKTPTATPLTTRRTSPSTSRQGTQRERQIGRRRRRRHPHMGRNGL